MFDTLVRLTAALKVRLPGIEEAPAQVDCSIPCAITLICQAETVADQQSLLCTSEEPECDCTECFDSSQMSTFCCSTETLIKTRSTAHGGGMHESTLYPGTDCADLSDAPREATGNIGFTAKTLPTDLSIHYLGLNQAQWQTLIMMYARDVVSTYAGIRIVDIYHTLMSTSAATHECSAKDIATIKAWHDKLFYLIDVGVPGMPALYTPASQARSMERSGDDYTKLLVPVIPDLVPVGLSTRSLTLAPLDENAPKWSRNFFA